ncbi:unnamed protein product [Rotaria sp. Silwood1]|nr:unnamed protein product [Rotaria sp. Silwood1]
MYQSILLLVVILTLYAATIAANSLEGRGLMNVCYDEYGCFTSGPPFGLTLHRPIALLPDSDKGQAISRHTTLGTWDRTKATKILVHGFLDSINSTWWPEMKDAFLQAEDCNVILTDWSRANYFPYTKATANAQVVGADIALLVNKMIKEHGVNPADFHIVAHSLGAAVAGYAGHRISGLGRITGLDPASPFFENTDPIVRLDPSDAKFVDIIHTDGSPTLLLGFGTLTQVGDVDFYPNGGMNQRSCDKTSAKLIHAILNLGPLDIFGPMDIQGECNMYNV